jgi:RNA-directed DNA polymerase
MGELLQRLVEASALPESTVSEILRSAPSRYKEFRIPKRNGGFRKIAQPAKELKILQRAFVEQYLQWLPIHQAATAYITGKSIKDNAAPHAGHGPILKMDFKDFFPSITGRDWERYAERYLLFDNAEDLQLSTQLLFHKPAGGRKLRLAIGAPSSPMLSNLIMFEFDSILTSMLEEENVIYTRYADDLTFSAPRTGFLTGVPRAVTHILRRLEFPTLRINRDKTTLITTKYHREVTGLTLSNDGEVTLGRERKRAIRAGLHYFKHQRLSPVEAEKLAGLVAFAKFIEPEFFSVLERTYGENTLYALASRRRRKKARSRGEEASIV